MNLKTRWLAAAALAALMAPAAALADDHNKGQAQESGRGGQPHASPPAQAPRPPAAQPRGAMQQHAPPQGHNMAGPQYQGNMQQRHDAMGRTAPPHEAFGRAPPPHEGFGRPAVREGVPHEGMAMGRPYYGGPAHVEMRDHWRSEHADWGAHAVWGRDHYWWRGNPAFSAYAGPRANFYFAPGFGYYQVPAMYWGRHWGVGAFLPLFFLTYLVADYAAYGLPPPPPGAAWVWVNNNVLLVNRSDGYVIDEVGNVW